LPDDELIIAAEIKGRSDPLSPQERQELFRRIPKVEAREVVDLGTHEPEKFHRTLTNGAKVVFIQISITKWEVPRLLLIYSLVSMTVNVQRFFGIFTDGTGNYAVMEDLEQGEPASRLLRDAFADENFQSLSFAQRLRLCYEIAVTVRYLHEVGLVVKILSDMSTYIRNVEGENFPVLCNLQEAREVSNQPS
jgi:serine/threonine protein kinase